ncbi:MAG: hypothetical protein ACRCST_10700 [Turicibacter sp.]
MNMNITINSLDIPRLTSDESYYKLIHDLICDGEYKPTDHEKFKIRLATGYWIRKRNIPSQDPSDHANDIANVRKVGLSKFLQDMSNYFARL